MKYFLQKQTQTQGPTHVLTSINKSKTRSHTTAAAEEADRTQVLQQTPNGHLHEGLASKHPLSPLDRFTLQKGLVTED